MPGEEVVDAHGGWLLPGLHDHHVHLRATAATASSIQTGPASVRDLDALAAALRSADLESPPGAWIRGVGYHESAAGRLDRWVLDRMLPDRPVRIQHRSGALWMLNSLACAVAGVDDCPTPGVDRDVSGTATGRLWRMDSWLGARVGTQAADLAWVSARAAAWGVTGFTDATPGLRQADVDGLADAIHSGRIAQRLLCMAPPGVEVPESARFSLGPTKILLDDDTLPTFDELTSTIRAAHAEARPVAVHCVTRVQLALTMAALDTAGHLDGDRVEHGAIIPAETLKWLRDNRITVVTQPHFVVERAAQYAAEVPVSDRPDLWRLGSLLTAGVGVAASTDAPFGGADPWSVIRAAVERDTNLGVGEDMSPIGEGISPAAAVTLFCGRPDQPAQARTVAPGERADLTLLVVGPEDIATVPSTELVAITVVDGAVVYRSAQCGVVYGSTECSPP